jgi:septal ring-binding cell division protein DamX
MSKDDTGEVKGVISSALLLAAVGVVIVAGMFLKTDVRGNLPRPGAPASASPAASLPLGSTITPELAPEPTGAEKADTETVTPAEPDPVPAPPDPLTVRLATRAEADCGRLAQSHGRFTAQLLVACKPETVDRILELAHGASSLYVLPVQVKDDACFRVCFGAYATSKQAAAAPDLPKALRGKEKIGAVEIAKVLP